MTENTGIAELVEKIKGQSPKSAAESLANLPAEEIRFVLSQLPQEQVLAVASHLPEGVFPEIADIRAATVSSTTGTEKTIGELMAPAPAVLPVEYTAAEAVAFLVKTKDISNITYIYVTADEALAGVVVMRDLILAKPAQSLSEIMVSEPFAFEPGTTIAEAISEALARHYPMYPVVNEERRIVGVVRGWQIHERIAAELSGQAGAQVGVAREEQVTTSVLQAFRMRHPWLQVNLLTAFAAAFVVGMFEDTITQVVALAAFLPVLAGQSGNTGCQALAITLRGLTLGKLRNYPVGKLLRKEILLGALNGLLVGLVAGAAMWAYAAMSGEPHPILLGLVILIAMIGACIGSGIFGVLVPLTLKKMGADPATASSIFLTTFTDIIGMGLMLFLATTLIL